MGMGRGGHMDRGGHHGHMNDRRNRYGPPESVSYQISILSLIVAGRYKTIKFSFRCFFAKFLSIESDEAHLINISSILRLFYLYINHQT